MASDDKLTLFRSHPCARGLSDEEQREISDAAVIVRLDSGEFLHPANKLVESVYFIIQGHVKQTVVDLQGKTLYQRLLGRGSQFGALAAAQAEPIPVELVATEPSVVLKLGFAETLRFTRKFDSFGLNLTRLISNMVGQVLLADRRPSKTRLISVFHATPMTRRLTQRLISKLRSMGESICLISDQLEAGAPDGVPFRALSDGGRVLEPEELRRQFNQWSDSDRIFIDVDATLELKNACSLVELSDQVVWCVDRDADKPSVGPLQAMEAREPGWRDKINLVRMLRGNEWVAPLSTKLRELVDREFKISNFDPAPNQGRALLDGFERLVHHLRGIRIGLALGGGGARGMAHLGVLKALRDNGIVVDMIAGTSAGAMAGILCAAGYDPEYIVNRFMVDLKPSRVFRMMPRGNHLYLLYKYRRGQFDQMLRKYLADWKLEQLPIPFRSVTVDLVSGRQVIRDRGDAVDAILESINLPVFSKPICRNGQALIDGGLVNNVPADVLVRNGCNFVIAVSVTAKLEQEFANNTPDMLTGDMTSGSVLQTILRSYLVQNVNVNAVGVGPADVVIEPDVAGVDLSEFSRTRELAAIGEDAVVQAMAKVRELLNQIDPQCFADSD